MGVHSGDHTIYPDCTEKFRNADEYAFKVGNWNSELVNYYTPYMEGNKFTILQDGESCCERLGLNFNEVYSRTNTSYKPIKIVTSGFIQTSPGIENTNWTSPVVTWYSDYKSASSVERIEAFMKLGKPDPVAYADETGPVSWNTVVEHVEKILKEHKN
jgi:7-cyano-7-deazaguanine synthase